MRSARGFDVTMHECAYFVHECGTMVEVGVRSARGCDVIENYDGLLLSAGPCAGGCPGHRDRGQQTDDGNPACEQTDDDGNPACERSGQKDSFATRPIFVPI